MELAHKKGTVASIICSNATLTFIYQPTKNNITTTHYEPGKACYEREFADAAPGQIRSEITILSLPPKVPERIYRYRANMLLIALLRDPVDRALSQYLHAFRHGFETLSLEDALAAEPERMASGDPYNHQKHSYVSRSRYEKQLKRYEGFFRRNQILLLRSEDLFHNTQQCWIKIQRFLGLNLQLTEQTLPWVNGGQGESASVSDDIRRRIRETLTPTYENLRKNYGISWD